MMMAGAALRSALARRRPAFRVEARLLSTKALCTDEWRHSLMSGMKQADAGESVVQPFRVEKELDRNLGTLILSAATRLTPSRPGNGGMRLWNYSTADLADVEAQVRRHGASFATEHSTDATSLPFAPERSV